MSTVSSTNLSPLNNCPWYNGGMTTDFITWLDAQILMSEYTKRQLAERAGVSTATLYQVTTYDRPPTADFCIKIAYALGLPTVEVLRRAGFDVIKSPPEMDDPWLSEAWSLVQQIPAEHRASCIEALRAWASDHS